MPYWVKIAGCTVLLGLLFGCRPSETADTVTSHFYGSVTKTVDYFATEKFSRTTTYTETTTHFGAEETLAPTSAGLGASTPSPTEYPTPWPEGFTPTTRPTPTRGLPPTATLSPKETCPAPTNIQAPVQLLSDPGMYEQQLLDFLSAHGNLHEFKEALVGFMGDTHSMDIEVYEEDITGDLNEEFIISLAAWDKAAFFFFGCRNGEYEVIHRIKLTNNEESMRWFASLTAVLDLNGDGIKEVVYSFVDNVGKQFTDITAQVMEWNGKEFRELLRDDPYPGSIWNRYAIDSSVEFIDIDGNGVMEVVFPNTAFWNDEGMGVFKGCDGGVARNSSAIWMWDGEFYRFMWREAVPPIYRFQAASDGDGFTSIGLFDRAEEMYLRAVFDDGLKPGSLGDWLRDMHCDQTGMVKPDITEPPRISAYARFRLVELYVHVGRVMEAESHRSYLRTNYPLGSPGYIYAYLANTFWWEYVKDMDISAACAAVRQEAEKFQADVFGLFENYGGLNPGPEISNICPF
jgi:hypothetical protein